MAGKRINPLTIPEVEHIAHTLAKEWMEFDEPIPPFKTRYPDSLESCITQPFFELGSKSAYPGLISKASIMFYLLIKNHPFVNGNKRIAITSLLTFTGKNGKWFIIQAQEFYSLAKWVAASNPEDKNLVINTIEGTLRKVIVSTDRYKKYIKNEHMKKPKIQIPKM